MKTISFTIPGNHKSATGNAIPKARLTRQQRWTDKAKDYVAWKDHVVWALLDSMPKGSKDKLVMANHVGRHGKPFLLGPSDHAFMALRIAWANKAHGDPENIFGSIADALFHNDKNVDCFTLSSMAKETKNGKPWGRVAVKIRLFESEDEKVNFLLKYKDPK